MTHLFLILYLLFVQSLFSCSILTLNLFKHSSYFTYFQSPPEKKKVELLSCSIYKRHDVEWDCPYIRARGSFVKCMTTPVWISDHVTLITILDSLSGSLLPRVRLATGDLSEITDKILAGSILWTSIPYGNFERACISLL